MAISFEPEFVDLFEVGLKADENKPIMLETISPKVVLTYNDIFDVTDTGCLIAKRTVSLDLVAKHEQ